MAYADWPSGVPYRPERNGWGFTPARPSLATEMEGGDTRQRRRPGDDLGTMQWSRSLSSTQMTAFRGFLDDIAGGVARFVMPVPVDGFTFESRVVQIQGGAGGVSLAANDILTRVSFTLLVFPASMTPPTVWLLDFSDSDNSLYVPVLF